MPDKDQEAAAAGNKLEASRGVRMTDFAPSSTPTPISPALNPRPEGMNAVMRKRQIILTEARDDGLFRALSEAD